VGQFGRFKIQAFLSTHQPYNLLPFRALEKLRRAIPFNWLGYKIHHDTSISYLIEHNNKTRIYFSDTPIFLHGSRVAKEVDPVDYLLLGIASRSNKNQIFEILAVLQPRFVIPFHYDNFFKPFYKFKKMDPFIRVGGYDFSKFKKFLTNFEKHYIVKAKELADETANGFRGPQLKLLKMFYTYPL